MKKYEFIVECNDRFIDPEIALENDEIQKALRDRDDEKVKALLDSEF